MLDEELDRVEGRMDEEVVFDMLFPSRKEVHLIDGLVIVHHQKHQIVML